MLRYLFYQILLLDRYFVPLPKLGAAQADLLASHLQERGFRVSRGMRLTARRGAQLVSVDAGLGLATSNADMLDALAPAVPQLLAGKAAAAGGSNPYYVAKASGDGLHIRLFARLEGLRTWSALRTAGQSGLTPDERRVIELLLDGRKGKVSCVTDYPVEGSRKVQLGRRLYYDSMVEVGRFIRDLRAIGEDGERRSAYLPRNSVLSLSGSAPHLQEEILRAAVGEWSFL